MAFKKIAPGTTTSDPELSVDKPSTTVKALENDDTMTWGKYKGTKMLDIPPTYLHYVYHNYHGPHTEPVKLYIENSISALKEENADLIWELRNAEK